MILKACEICGNSSICMVVDIEKRADPRVGVIWSNPHGDPHFFCAVHERNSITTQGSEIHWAVTNDLFDVY